MKNMMKTMICALTLSVAMTAIPASVSASTYFYKYSVYPSKGLKFRESPSSEAPIIYTENSYSEINLQVMDCQNNFYYCSIPDTNYKGWIDVKDVSYTRISLPDTNDTEPGTYFLCRPNMRGNNSLAVYAEPYSNSAVSYVITDKDCKIHEIDNGIAGDDLSYLGYNYCYLPDQKIYGWIIWENLHRIEYYEDNECYWPGAWDNDDYLYSSGDDLDSWENSYYSWGDELES